MNLSKYTAEAIEHKQYHYEGQEGSELLHAGVSVHHCRFARQA